MPAPGLPARPKRPSSERRRVRLKVTQSYLDREPQGYGCVSEQTPSRRAPSRRLKSRSRILLAVQPRCLSVHMPRHYCNQACKKPQTRPKLMNKQQDRHFQSVPVPYPSHLLRQPLLVPRPSKLGNAFINIKTQGRRPRYKTTGKATLTGRFSAAVGTVRDTRTPNVWKPDPSTV